MADDGSAMTITVQRAEYQYIERLRGLYREEAGVQLIHDSALGRGIADPYIFLVDGRVAGYGGVWNKYDPDRILEFYVLPQLRGAALSIFREFAAVSRATSMEAQTNVPQMLLMLYDCATGIAAENYLFADAGVTTLPSPGGVFRAATADDGDPGGEFVIEMDGAIVAQGGFLCHYNPPYGDIYMGVAEHARRRGFGSYIVQELKRVCYEAGRRPSARCNANNAISRRTLEKAGFRVCARLLTGTIEPTAPDS
jgi:GNAT superfamily N-acetyltransferase